MGVYILLLKAGAHHLHNGLIVISVRFMSLFSSSQKVDDSEVIFLPIKHLPTMSISEQNIRQNYTMSVFPMRHKTERTTTEYTLSLCCRRHFGERRSAVDLCPVRYRADDITLRIISPESSKCL